MGMTPWACGEATEPWRAKGAPGEWGTAPRNGDAGALGGELFLWWLWWNAPVPARTGCSLLLLPAAGA